MSVSESVCLYVCSLTPPKRRGAGEPQRAEISRDDFFSDKESFRLKPARIHQTVSREIACIVLHPSVSLF